MSEDTKKDLSVHRSEYAKSPILLRAQKWLAQLTLQQKMLAILVVIGASLRLYQLTEKSIWLDEAFSIAISQHSLADILRMVVQTDTHPPLYYLLLKMWLVLGDGEAQVRLLSALFSVASIVLIYLVGKNIFEDERIGLIAAAVLAFSPFHIWYAQETRMYAMLTCFILISAYFFFRALRFGNRRDWIWFVLTTALALYTDNGAFWYVATISIFFLLSLRRYKERLTGWLISMAAIGLLYLPWLPFFWTQTRRVTEDFWLQPPSFQTVLETLLDFHNFNFPYIELSLVYMATIFILAYIIPRKGWQLRLTSLWLFIPLVFSLLVSLRQPIFLSRNLIAASLGYYLLVAGTVGQFRSSKAVLAFLLPLVAMNFVSIGYNAINEEKEDWRATAAYVAQEVKDKPGGLVIFLPGYAELPFQYYYSDYEASVETQGYPGDEILLHPKPKEVGDLNALFKGVPYVWLVVRDIETVDPNWSVKGWLDSHGYVRQEDWINEQLTVLNYSRWDKAPVSISPNGVGTESKVFLPHVYRGMEFQTYVVSPGETLLEIALRFDTTIQVLMDANQILNPNSISEGQELIVPITGTTDSTSGNPYP